MRRLSDTVVSRNEVRVRSVGRRSFALAGPFCQVLDRLGAVPDADQEQMSLAGLVPWRNSVLGPRLRTVRLSVYVRSLTARRATRFDEETLGEPPYQVTLTVGKRVPEFEQTWTWPDDLDADGTLTGPMTTTSGEPFHPDGDTDPLLDAGE